MTSLNVTKSYNSGSVGSGKFTLKPDGKNTTDQAQERTITVRNEDGRKVIFKFRQFAQEAISHNLEKIFWAVPYTSGSKNLTIQTNRTLTIEKVSGTSNQLSSSVTVNGSNITTIPSGTNNLVFSWGENELNDIRVDTYRFKDSSGNYIMDNGNFITVTIEQAPANKEVSCNIYTTEPALIFRTDELYTVTVGSNTYKEPKYIGYTQLIQNSEEIVGDYKYKLCIENTNGILDRNGKGFVPFVIGTIGPKNYIPSGSGTNNTGSSLTLKNAVDDLPNGFADYRQDGSLWDLHFNVMPEGIGSVWGSVSSAGNVAKAYSEDYFKSKTRAGRVYNEAGTSTFVPSNIGLAQAWNTIDSQSQTIRMRVGKSQNIDYASQWPSYEFNAYALSSIYISSYGKSYYQVSGNVSCVNMDNASWISFDATPERRQALGGSNFDIIPVTFEENTGSERSAHIKFIVNDENLDGRIGSAWETIETILEIKQLANGAATYSIVKDGNDTSGSMNFIATGIIKQGDPLYVQCSYNLSQRSKATQQYICNSNFSIDSAVVMPLGDDGTLPNATVPVVGSNITDEYHECTKKFAISSGLLDTTIRVKNIAATYVIEQGNVFELDNLSRFGTNQGGVNYDSVIRHAFYKTDGSQYGSSHVYKFFAAIEGYGIGADVDQTNTFDRDLSLIYTPSTYDANKYSTSITPGRNLDSDDIGYVMHMTVDTKVKQSA